MKSHQDIIKELEALQKRLEEQRYYAQLYAIDYDHSVICKVCGSPRIYTQQAAAAFPNTCQPWGQCIMIPNPHANKPSAASKVSGPVFCTKCNEKNDFAEPNQPDGSYMCYGCRQ